MNNLAPVYMTTYRRLSHVRRSIEALRKNELADETVLYISSDGPMPGDEAQVFAVRDYLKSIDGFKEVELCFREKNDRSMNDKYAQNLLNQYGKIIFLEEDCETSPYFLSYMNAMLDRYEDDSSIFAVCGYTYPLKSARSLDLCSIKLPCFVAWGYGIWKDRNDLVQSEITVTEYKKLLRSRWFNRKLVRETGIAYLGMYKLIAEGKLQAFDTLATLEMSRRSMYAVFPSRSLVINHGHDGTGEHCGLNDQYVVDLMSTFDVDVLSQEPLLCKKAIHELAMFHNGGYKGLLSYFFKRLRGRYSIK